MTVNEKYFEYLKTRSVYGVFYRNFWLYPRISKLLNGRVLDIGCGIGDFLKFRKNTVGVDVNPETVKYCQEQGHDARLMEVDILPFDSSSFNSVVMDNVLEHIEDPEPILNEVKRVLIDGGCFVIGVPGRKGYASDPDHKVFYSKEKLLDTINGAGFSGGEVVGMPFDFAWLDDKLRQYCLYGIFRK